MIRRLVRWIVRPALERLRAGRLRRLTVSDLPRLRQYALDHCPADEVQKLRSKAGRRLVLGVVGGYPFLGYVALGYDWKAPYYNPHLLFEEVHYFQNLPTPSMVRDLGYPLYVHRFKTSAEIARICRQYGVDVLRAYDSFNGEVAVDVGSELNIPVLVSVH